MASRAATSTVLVALTFFLAGCVGAVSGPAADGPAGGNQSIDPDALMIRGVVTDTEIRPLANVSILVKPGDLSTITNEAGAFLVGPVEPGMYEVVAGGAGFKEKLVQVDVSHGGENKAFITLTDPIGGQPYYETQIYVTYTFCTTSGAPCAPVNTVTSQNITPDQPDLKWSVPAEGLSNMLYEVWWQPTVFDGDKSFTTRNPEGLFLGCNESANVATPTYIYFSGEGPPGFGMWIWPNTVNDGGCVPFEATPGKYYYTVNRPRTTNATIPLGLVVDQRISNYLTFFYHLAGPTGFTAVPDQ
jgi:hypothetical protein